MTARSTAQTNATTIRDETVAAQNTHTRVGGNLKELADNAAFTEDLAATTISAAGLATGGGSLAANRTITVTAGAIGDIADLGTKAAGASGKAADAAHVHLMPRLDQIAAPTASVGFNAQRSTGLAEPTGDQDGSTKSYADLPHPAIVTRIGTDFATGFTGALSATIPVEGFIAANVGAGAAVTILTTGNTDTIVGVAQCSTGTTTTGLSILLSGSTTAGGTVRAVTAAKIVIDVKISVVTLSNGTDTFNTLSGVLDSANATNNGVWFSHDANTDTHWIMNTKSGGTGTSTATTITVVPGQEYHLVAIKSAGGNSVDFYIDGVLVGTIATNVPTTNNVIPMSAVKKSAGTTARTANVDWIYVTSVYARAA